MLGASNSELALVGMLFLMVLVAPKIPRIGEWIGGRFESDRPPPGPPPAPAAPRVDAATSDERDRQPPR